MKNIIQAFLDSAKIAIAGASPNKDNFGLYLMTELEKRGKEIFPVNPKYEQINGKACMPTVKDLPGDVESLDAISSDVEALCRGFPLYPGRWDDAT